MSHADEPNGDRRQPSECGNGAKAETMKKIKTNRGCWTIDEKMAQTYIHYELANTLAQRDYKMPQAVLVVDDEFFNAENRRIQKDGSGVSDERT